MLTSWSLVRLVQVETWNDFIYCISMCMVGISENNGRNEVA